MLCTERSLVKHEGQALTCTPLRCKCWSCDHCAPNRRRDLKWKARNAAPTIFLTLTVKRGLYPTPEAQAAAMATGWRMLRQYLCRLLDRKAIPFLAIVEKHKSGWPHLHILLRTKYIDHRLIREWWVGRFNSPQIWIEQVDDQRKAAVYVSKYLAKHPERFEGCKRYWCSQDWDLAKNKVPKVEHEADVWFEAVTSRPISLARMAFYDGATVKFEGDKIVITRWAWDARSKWGLR